MNNSDDFIVAGHPYRKSWLNQLPAWIERLPGAFWLDYLSLSVISLVIMFAVMWFEGSFSLETLAIFAYLIAAIFGLMAFTRHADQRAAKALNILRPILKTGDDEFNQLIYEISYLPARQTLLASILLMGVVYLSELVFGPYAPEGLEAYPFSATLLRVVYYLCWWVFSAFVYHTIHQLRLIHRIYTQETTINLFRMKPLYALSDHSAQTAGFLTLVPYGWLLVNPNLQYSHPAVLGFVIAITMLALVTFVWPQLGIHRLQVSEKDRLLDEANMRIERCLDELHRLIDQGNLSDVSQLQVTLNSLTSELAILKGVHTWPWQLETVRWFATALIVPLSLWFLQFLLQRLLTE
jgi:hypothetical protein